MRTLTLFFFGLFFLIPFPMEAQTTNSENLRNSYLQQWEALLTTDYLPLRKSIPLSVELQKELQGLKTAYLKELNLQKTPDLAKQKAFRMYPHIAQVLLNKSTLTESQVKTYSEQVVNVWKKMPNSVFSPVAKITDALKRDQFHLTFPYPYQTFNDLIDSSPRQRDQVLNFLLWNP
ncbi:hypothetical protein [Chryseobacterium sp. A321]